METTYKEVVSKLTKKPGFDKTNPAKFEIEIDGKKHVGVIPVGVGGGHMSDLHSIKAFAQGKRQEVSRAKLKAEKLDISNLEIGMKL